MGQKRASLPPGGPTLPSLLSQRRCCGPGGRRQLAAGRSWISADVEGGLEAVSEGGDGAHTPGGGATVERGAAFPSREEESGRGPVPRHRCLPAALLQGSGARRPTQGSAGEPGQQ